MIHNIAERIVELEQIGVGSRNLEVRNAAVGLLATQAVPVQETAKDSRGR